MTAYELVLRNTDDSTEQILASDTVAEGETDEWAVTVENPGLVGGALQTAGN